MNAKLVPRSKSPTARQESWPNYGLFTLGISVTLYLKLTEVVGVDIRPVQLGPVLATLAAVLCLPATRKEVPRLYFVLPCIWASYMLVRHMVFEDTTQLICVRTLVNVSAYLAALKLMLRNGRVHWLLAGLLAGMLLSVALSLANINVPQMVTSSVRMGNGRWQGLMPGANRFANLCAIAFITGIGLFKGRSPLLFRLTLGLLTASALLGLAMSGSRGATLTAGVSAILLLWFASRLQGRLFLSPNIMLSSTLALTIGLALFTYNKELLPERLVALIESPDDTFAKIEDDSRRDLFEIAYETFLESPIFGAGASAAVFTVSTRQGEIEITSHNMYLHFLATSGLAGLIGYLMLPLFMLFRLGRAVLFYRRRYNQDTSLIPVALGWLLLILLHGCVISIGQTAHIWLFFAATAFVCITQTEQRPPLWPARARSQVITPTIPPTRRRKPVLPRVAR